MSGEESGPFGPAVILVALRVAAGEDRRLRRLVFGVAGVTLAVPWLGYLSRVLQAGTAADETAPTLDDWVDMSAAGVRQLGLVLVCAVVFGNAVVQTVVIGSGVLRAGAVALPQDDVSRAALAVSVALTLVGVYVVPGAAAHVARAESIRSLRDYRSILRTTATEPYAAGWLLGTGVAVPGVFLTLGLLVASTVLAVVGLVVLFYASVAAAYLYGRGYGAAHDRTEA